MKSRPSQQKRLAAVLGKTLRELEAKEETDANDPAFVQLKSHLVQRIIQLETDAARARAIIHIVDEQESGEKAAEAAGDDTAIA